MMLFFKECKKVLFSFTFLLYCIALFAMYFSQYNFDLNDKLTPPSPNQDYYGMVTKEIPEVLMPAAIESLVTEYLSDNFGAYPIGFYKNVHLNEKKATKIAKIIEEVSGITKEELDNFTDFDENGSLICENGEYIYVKPEIPEINIPESLTYEHFRELMREADDIIGGGSKYSDDYIIDNFSNVPKTYEEALEEYNQIFSEDKIMGAYARLYCDYIGIVVSVLPVFMAVSLAGKDKKSRMESLVYSRNISSTKLIFTRYLSLVFCAVMPVIITTLITMIEVNVLYPDNDISNIILFKYTIIWLVPNIMISLAVGMLITELTSGLLGIFVQGAWWCTSIFISGGNLTGAIGKFTLVARHNSLYGLQLFKDTYSDFIFNRTFFTVISILAIALTVFIYEKKRRGTFNAGTIFNKNFKCKPEA